VHLHHLASSKSTNKKLHLKLGENPKILYKALCVLECFQNISTSLQAKLMELLLVFRGSMNTLIFLKLV
jgi:hypothetical protein